MSEITLYTTTKINKNTLREFTFSGFKSTYYGYFGDEIFFIYGIFNNPEIKKDKQILENEEALKYLAGSFISKMKLLDLGNSFAKHLCLPENKIDFQNNTGKLTKHIKKIAKFPYGQESVVGGNYAIFKI